MTSIQHLPPKSVEGKVLCLRNRWLIMCNRKYRIKVARAVSQKHTRTSEQLLNRDLCGIHVTNIRHIEFQKYEKPGPK